MSTTHNDSLDEKDILIFIIISILVELWGCFGWTWICPRIRSYLALIFCPLHWISPLDLSTPFGSLCPAARPCLGNYLFSTQLLLGLVRYPDPSHPGRLPLLHPKGIYINKPLYFLLFHVLICFLFIQVWVALIQTTLEPVTNAIGGCFSNVKVAHTNHTLQTV